MGRGTCRRTSGAVAMKLKSGPGSSTDAMNFATKHVQSSYKGVLSFSLFMRSTATHLKKCDGYIQEVVES